MSPIDTSLSPSSSLSSSSTKHHYTEDVLVKASGIYAYHCVNSDTNPIFANIRATSLSMACGLLSQRFYGDVFIARLGYFQHMDGDNDIIYMMKNRSLSVDEIKYASYVSPDLRKGVIKALIPPKKQQEETEEGKGIDQDTNIEEEEIIIPTWLTDAAKSNYEDAAALDLLASTMNKQKKEEKDDDQLDDDDDDDDDDQDKDTDMSSSKTMPPKKNVTKQVVARTPLCIQCRRPCKDLCSDCEGVYFCSEQCKASG